MEDNRMEITKKPIKITETILRDAHPVSYTHLTLPTKA